MSLRMFCDQCVPVEISEILRRAGHEVILLRDALPIRAPDPVVLAKAQELGTILVSLNGDFSDIVTYPPDQHHGIIALQLHNHPEIIPYLMQGLIAFIDAHPQQEYYHHKLIIAEPHRVRIRQ
jgi:predicted nuclease of predicted toxin-antitoxin system